MHNIIKSNFVLYNIFWLLFNNKMQYVIIANSIMAVAKKIIYAIANVIIIVAIVFAWWAMVKYFTNYRKCRKYNMTNKSNDKTSSSDKTSNMGSNVSSNVSSTSTSSKTNSTTNTPTDDSTDNVSDNDS